MNGLEELFGSGGDKIVRGVNRNLMVMENEWKAATRELSEFLMPTSYKNAIESIEYGFSDSIGNRFSPAPFMRVARMRYSGRWRASLDEAEAKFKLIGEDVTKTINDIGDGIRADIYDTAVEYGVPHSVAEVFAFTFSKNNSDVGFRSCVLGRGYRAIGTSIRLGGVSFRLDRPVVVNEKTGARGFVGRIPEFTILKIPSFV